MDQETFDQLFDRYWSLLKEENDLGSSPIFARKNVNPRRIETITDRDIKLRETTERGAPSKSTKAVLRDEFWTLYGDPGLRIDGVRMLGKRHGIKDLAEFKRAMFDDFAEFAKLGLAIGDSREGWVLRRVDYEPTADPDLLEKRTVKWERAGTVSVPVGNLKPQRAPSPTTRFIRDPRVRAWVRVQSAGRCDACGQEGYETDDGVRHLDVHHMIPLASGGPDVTENAVAVCETCHGKLHRWTDRDAYREKLYRAMPRLRRKFNDSA